jgi:tetratricopeptide (TPR) repeat protein
MKMLIAVDCATLTLWLAACFADEPPIRAGDSGDNLQLAADLLRYASKLAAEQDESQSFWTCTLLLQIGEVQMRAGDFDGARQSIRSSTYDAGRQDGLVQLAESLAGTGDWQEALDLLQEMDFDSESHQVSVSDNVRLRWIDYLIATGDLAQAQQVAAEMESADQRPDGYRRLAVACANAGAKPASDRYFEQALDAAGAIDGYARAAAIWNTGEAQISVGTIDAARATTRQLVDTADELDAWAMVAALREAAVLSAMLQEHPAAGTLFRRAIDAQQRVASMSKAEALKYIAVAQARVGHIEAALATIELATGSGHDQALLAVAMAQLKANDPIAAERTALSITEYLQYHDDALHAIVDDRIARAEFHTALATAQNVENHLRRAAAILKIAVGCAQSGDRRLAGEIASQIKLTNDSILMPPAHRPVFDYRQPETWGTNYDLGHGGTSLSRRLSDERTAEVAKWAMTLAQAMTLEPAPDYPESFKDVRSEAAIQALARAHAATGNIGEAFAWAQAIGSDRKVASRQDQEASWALQRRIHASVGVAEGILDRMGGDTIRRN